MQSFAKTVFSLSFPACAKHCQYGVICCLTLDYQQIKAFFPAILSFCFKNIQTSMKNQNRSADLSYFRLLLADFLGESHPQLLSDAKFIAARADAALTAYEQAASEGSNPVEAEHSANETLFAGLHFSKYDTLKNILWNEFFDTLPEDSASELAIMLLPECESVFARYPLSDDFAFSPEYEMLYAELTGTAALLIEGRTPFRSAF
jgi:hypothetical protein